MNFGINLIVLTLPMLINCLDIGSVRLQFEKAIHKSANDRSVLKTGDFESKIEDCINKIPKNDPGYHQCISDKFDELHGISSEYDPKLQCCTRMTNYKCMKYFLTMFCEVPKEEVDQNLDVLFSYLNNVNVPGYPNHCKGNRQESLNYCFSTDSSSSTTESVTTPKTTGSPDSSSALACNIPLQLTFLFVLYLFCFKL